VDHPTSKQECLDRGEGAEAHPENQGRASIRFPPDPPTVVNALDENPLRICCL
jgi:hypothetical protein